MNGGKIESYLVFEKLVQSVSCSEYSWGVHDLQ